MIEIARQVRYVLDAPIAPRPSSWVDSRIEARFSSISGMGLFATAPIAVGEVVVVWGGRLFSRAEVDAGIPRERSLAMIDHDLFLGSLPEEPVTIDEFMNHACAPNVWLADAVTLVARNPIARNEELTIDYALWDTDSAWSMACNCRSPICRGINTGDDWRIPALQLRYQGHFSPYVARMIARSRHGQA
jgi:uncharacterized protein